MEFVNRTFRSYEEFEQQFVEFKSATFSVFRKKSSETVEKANVKAKHKIANEFVYSRVDFCCTHFGEPRYRGKGIKSKTNHLATGCKASFTLKYDYYERHFKIIKPVLVHNHPTTPDTYRREYQVKRLDQVEREELREIVELQPRNENLRQMVNTRYNKAYTLTEIRSLKHQLQSGRTVDAMVDIADSLEGIQDHGHVKVVVSNNGTDSLLDIVAFATHSMSALFRKFPEVIYMDGTYKNNQSGYPLYQVMIEDSCGRGRTVFYAFVRQENADLLGKMVGIFVEMMGESVSKTVYAMTDKDPNEINALKEHMPHVKSVLCAFHVHRAMKAKITKLHCNKELRERLQQLAYVLVISNDVATFSKKLEEINCLNKEFFEYLQLNWLPIVSSWAYHARLNRRLFLNDTNNKCEGENRRLKEILNSNISLSVAVRRLFQHSLAQEFEVDAASILQATCTTVYRDANPSWRSLYSQFSDYAAQLMIQDHRSCPLPVTGTDVNGVYQCRDPSGVFYRCSGQPLSCQCPFFLQTSLPCCHMLSIFSSFATNQNDLYSLNNRWLKSNIRNEAHTPQMNPRDRVILNVVVGPEARHHRTEALQARLSCLLKLCGSLQFQERVEKVETLIDAWERNLDCIVIAVVNGQNTDTGEVDGSGEVGGIQVDEVVEVNGCQVGEIAGVGEVDSGQVSEVAGVGEVDGSQVDEVADVDQADGSQIVEVAGADVDQVDGSWVAGANVDQVDGSQVAGANVDQVDGSQVAGANVDQVNGSQVDEVADVDQVDGSQVDEVAGADVDQVDGSQVDDVAGADVGEVNASRVDEVAGVDVDEVNGSQVDGGVGVAGSSSAMVGDVVGVCEAVTVSAEVGERSSSVGVTLSEMKTLNVKVPTVRKRGRPKQLRTRSYKKAKKVRFDSSVCYSCFKEEVPRELCKEGSIMDWVGCSSCPRWFHTVCLDDPVGDAWLCAFCN